MGFQINAEEFEVAEDNKKTDINFEIADVIRKIEFLNDRYEERIKAVRQRKKSLMQKARVFSIIAIVFIFMAILLFLIINGNGGMAFGIWAVILFVITGLVIIVNTARVVWSYCIHIGLILNSSIYTLQMEERDIQHYKKQLEEGKERLEQFLKRGNRDEEAGRLLLEELAPQLKEEERHADYLYGEK
ncbi:MAG: amastin family protein [Bacteroides sp.]|nr:amastin family protein [Bacteroides sp.]MCM1548537.1 amastin family protein [Clostridium sp.]